MKNAITYVSPKNKRMAHITSLNNSISCVVGISIFIFKKYWKIVFNLMELNMRLNFKQFLQSKTDSTNKLYHKLYDVKIMMVFHKQTMTKQ